MDIVSDSVETAEGGSSESDITNCSDGSLSSQSDHRTESEVTSGGKTQYTLLDLYSGCGGMSTGLCMGASLSSVKLVTVNMYFERVLLNTSYSFLAFLSFFLCCNYIQKWALDLNPYACKSLEYNHPETQVCMVKKAHMSLVYLR